MSRTRFITCTLVILGLFAVSPGVLAWNHCVKPPDGLVGWWTGDGNAKDVVGNRDGALQNGATFSAGKVRKAFSLDGVNQFVQVPDSDLWTLGSRDFTIDLWVNFSEVVYRSPFVGHDEGGGQTNKWIFWYDEFGHDTPSGPALRFTRGEAIPTLHL
jgi:hypothetical protein